MFHCITVPCTILWDFGVTDQEVEISQGERTMHNKN